MSLVRRATIRVKRNRRWLEVPVFVRRRPRRAASALRVARRLNGRLGLWTFRTMKEAAE